ncbi:PH domain-containing protein [Catalinimonas sp. 4WD22]|uniref:PH domain-containing protein n=1 Tax=Catalinimonas locisalis TaxID=3133978 RepID=UPI0031019733
MISRSMKFWSKRDYSMGALLWGLPVLSFILFIPFFFYHNQSFILYQGQMIALLILGGLTTILFYTWFFTYYLIEQDQLKYKAGFFSGSLDIHTIESIKRSEYILSGNRPAMSFEGLLIRYGGNRMIFISPENETEFLEALQSINSKLTLK